MRRFLIALLISFILGILCAYMATIRKPVPITPLLLLDTVYTRTLAGL